MEQKENKYKENVESYIKLRNTMSKSYSTNVNNCLRNPISIADKILTIIIAEIDGVEFRNK